MPLCKIHFISRLIGHKCCRAWKSLDCMQNCTAIYQILLTVIDGDWNYAFLCARISVRAITFGLSLNNTGLKRRRFPFVQVQQIRNCKIRFLNVIARSPNDKRHITQACANCPEVIGVFEAIVKEWESRGFDIFKLLT